MAVELPRLLVAGVGPIPPERPDRLYAPGLRIWGMARELVRAGHPVRLVLGRFGDELHGGPGRRYDLIPIPDEEPRLPPEATLALPGDSWPELIKIEAAQFKARAAIGSSDVMNHALAASGIGIPIWMDYFGDPMAERQLLALRGGNDDGLLDQWNLVAPALARADKLSGCSADQCAAMLGQLGAVGRLNRFTACTRLVHRIPPWPELIPIDIDCDAIVRGVRTPENAYLIVQTGGFNTWLDIHALFAALEQAMAANPRIHFAASGGVIPGHHAEGYEWFAMQVSRSRWRDRFHLVGWLPLGQVPRLIAEGDMGLNMDLQCPEGIFGTRNRLMDWIIGGLRVVTTPGCELAQELGELELATIVPPGDADAAARAILAGEALGEKAHHAEVQAAGKWLRRAHAPEICLAPLLEWAAAPKPASDLHGWAIAVDRPPTLLDHMVDAAEASREARRKAQRLAWLERRLAELEGSRVVRWAMRLRRGRAGDGEEPPREL